MCVILSQMIPLRTSTSHSQKIINTLLDALFSRKYYRQPNILMEDLTLFRYCTKPLLLFTKMIKSLSYEILFTIITIFCIFWHLANSSMFRNQVPKVVCSGQSMRNSNTICLKKYLKMIVTSKVLAPLENTVLILPTGLKIESIQ